MNRLCVTLTLLAIGLCVPPASAQTVAQHGTVAAVSGETVRIELADAITVEAGVEGRVVQERSIAGTVRQINAALFEVTRVERPAAGPWVAVAQITSQVQLVEAGDGAVFEETQPRPATLSAQTVAQHGTVAAVSGETVRVELADTLTVELGTEGRVIQERTIAGRVRQIRIALLEVVRIEQALDGPWVAICRVNRQTQTPALGNGVTFQTVAARVPVDDDGANEEKIFIVVETKPELIGGMRALQEAVEYPEFAKEAGIEGRVFVQFIVDEQGNVTNPQVTRGVNKLLDESALEAVREMKFKPGKQRGKAVKVQMSLPVTFRLR